MRQQADLVAIDVGTTKVCTFVGRVDSLGDIQLIGYGLAKSDGLRKGVVVDPDRAREATAASVLEAKRSSGVAIESAYVGITGAQVISSSALGYTALNSRRPIADKDIRKAHLPTDPTDLNDILHVIPLGYSVDGQPSEDPPIGMHGLDLRSKNHVISIPPGPLQNLRTVVEGAGVHVRGMVLEPIASGHAVLSDEEKERGVVVADIGGGTTDIAVFLNGKVIHTAIIPVGGYQITNDIALYLGTPYVSAEDLKIDHGSVYTGKRREIVRVPSIGYQKSRPVSPSELSLIIRERISELFQLTLQKLLDVDLLRRIPAGLVLTGGSSCLPGIDKLAQDILRLPVRIGTPTEMFGLPEDFLMPEFATAAGVLLWAHDQGRDIASPTSPEPMHLGKSGGVGGWMRNLFTPA